MLPLGSYPHARNLFPHLESFAYLLTVLGRRKPMPAWSKVLGNGTIRGEKALRMPSGLEPLHAPLALAGRLVRILRAVVEIAVLAVLYTWQDLPLRCAITFQLVRNDHPW